MTVYVPCLCGHWTVAITTSLTVVNVHGFSPYLQGQLPDRFSQYVYSSFCHLRFVWMAVLIWRHCTVYYCLSFHEKWETTKPKNQHAQDLLSRQLFQLVDYGRLKASSKVLKNALRSMYGWQYQRNPCLVSIAPSTPCLNAFWHSHPYNLVCVCFFKCV